MSENKWIENNRRVIKEFLSSCSPPKGPASGQTRINPLIALPDGENYFAVASKGGAPENPSWYHNPAFSS